ncbi:MAG: alkaline phosphatase D family protein [Planctomycetes bacterium]|nr:alkaline phosphatase D family protein [Planctomycetota bacterium]
MASGSLGAFAFAPRCFQEPSSAADAEAGGLGPFLGACAPGEMRLWLRKPPGGGTGVRFFSSLGPQTKEAPALERADGCKTFLFDRLPKADTRTNAQLQWMTEGDLPPPDVIRDRQPMRRIEFAVPTACYPMTQLRLAIGSCANEKAGETNPVWKAILAAKPDALALIGDTPYIETTDLATQRRRYREFYSNPDLAALMQVTPTWATWDDHDFAGDGSDGTAKGKEDARRAFVEYHALASYGEHDQGIYTRFQLGAADVFLLDTRWFSGTEPSFADATKTTLLGKQQWEWLTRGLLESHAPFKLLVCGMVWNGAVRPNKPDYWMAYPHERAALFEFLAKEKIAGVVLVSGDIHRSRVFAFPPEDTGVPYPLHELVTSPLGNHPMAAANVPSKDLRFDSDEKHQFLLLDVAPEKLVARFHAAAKGELHRLELDADGLRPHAAITPTPRTEDWAQARTQAVMARSNVEGARVLFLGDSITEGWELGAGAALWKAHFVPLGAVNLGVSGERTENLLWRLDHGQLAGYAQSATPPKLAVLLLGTNNFGYGTPSTPAEVAQGLSAIVARVRRKLPETRVLVLALFPRQDDPKIAPDWIPSANALAARLADGKDVLFADLGAALLEPDGSMSTRVLPDKLHLSEEGYRRWRAALLPHLERQLRD